jgi:hypothetical protein
VPKTLGGGGLYGCHKTMLQNVILIDLGKFSIIAIDIKLMNAIKFCQ